MTGKSKAESVEEMDEQLSGGYMYEGDGDWFYINGVELHGGQILFDTDAVNYETVPHDLRDEAYEMHTKGEVVIVHSEDIDLID